MSVNQQQQLKDLFSLIGNRTLIMGILNATPDSFSDGGQFSSIDDAVRYGVKMAEDGADIIDVGGESTRPGAEPVSPDEEINRVCPIIERLSSETSAPISIDTMKSEVAEAALESGACIINDVSGSQHDPDTCAVVARHEAGLVIMHMRGTPRTMQSSTRYADLIGEISRFLSGQAQKAITAGVRADRIIIDPGFGFSKTPEQNLALIRDLKAFRSLGYPILLGTSRKSTLGIVAGDDEGPLSRMESTAATIALAINNGVDIVRVHDVRQMARAVRTADAIVRPAVLP